MALAHKMFGFCFSFFFLGSFACLAPCKWSAVAGFFIWQCNWGRKRAFAAFCSPTFPLLSPTPATKWHSLFVRLGGFICCVALIWFWWYLWKLKRIWTHRHFWHLTWEYSAANVLIGFVCQFWCARPAGSFLILHSTCNNVFQLQYYLKAFRNCLLAISRSLMQFIKLS